MFLPPPETQELVELTPQHIETAQRQARTRKRASQYKAFCVWQQLNCTLTQNEETGYWEYVRRPLSKEEPPPNPKTVDEVELTPEEADQALDDMQQRVWGDLHTAYQYQQGLLRQQQEAHQQHAGTHYSAQQVYEHVWRRGEQVTRAMMPPRPFSLPEGLPQQIFRLLVYYFALDERRFVQLGQQLYGRTLSLHKGLLLMGPPGVGKSTMLRAFQTNPHRPFGLISTERVEEAYQAGKEGKQQQNFFAGNDGRHLCFDDAGVEKAEVKDYGNTELPMAQTLFRRHRLFEHGRLPSWATHMSTNNPIERSDDMPADMPSLRELYKDRVADRMYELFNIIEFTGHSRR